MIGQAESTEIRLFRRVLASPYTGRRFWTSGPRVELAIDGVGWILRDRGLHPHDGAPVDASIALSRTDVAAMLDGGVPPGTVRAVLGERDAAPRLKQARCVLALAALGWCGPWPDPAVDPEHVRLVRAAHYDLGIGPADGEVPLFAPGAPVEGVWVRLTHGVRGVELATLGLADRAGWPEVSTVAPPRTDPRRALPLLRAAALLLHESGRLPRALPGGTHPVAPHPAFPDGLALPNQLTWLLRVG